MSATNPPRPGSLLEAIDQTLSGTRARPARSSSLNQLHHVIFRIHTLAKLPPCPDAPYSASPDLLAQALLILQDNDPIWALPS